ncbi:MAG: hypothetical protein ACXVCJ_28910, partial [Polyangiales bacterium]
VTGAPRGTRSPCAGDVAVCGGSCNGAKTTDCSYAPTTKSCGRACTDGKATQKICDGLGACVEGERKPCLPYACEDTERCRIDCTADSHCAPTYKCSGGVCVSIGGAKCTPDNSGSISADGKESSCGAFTCDPSTGNCRPICQISADCAPDNICNTATKACEPPPPEASGGCAFAPPSSGAALGLLLLCAAIARGRRIDRKR